MSIDIVYDIPSDISGLMESVYLNKNLACLNAGKISAHRLEFRTGGI
jgi:hypothetical protein